MAEPQSRPQTTTPLSIDSGSYKGSSSGRSSASAASSSSQNRGRPWDPFLLFRILYVAGTAGSSNLGVADTKATHSYQLEVWPLAQIMTHNALLAPCHCHFIEMLFSPEQQCDHETVFFNTMTNYVDTRTI